MQDQVEVDPSYIVFCGWTADGWQLIYDISHLHPDWDQLIQTYQVISQTYEGHLIYESSFTLFRQQERPACSLASYPKVLKAELWETIFAVKRKFFTEVEPDIVAHFIKEEHAVEQRYQLYAKYLALPGYQMGIEPTIRTFTYTKLPAVEDESQFAV
ncbi:MAG: hypothetical protein ACRYFZ_18090 [Janthinobacterium lividum]